MSGINQQLVRETITRYHWLPQVPFSILSFMLIILTANLILVKLWSKQSCHKKVLAFCFNIIWKKKWEQEISLSSIIMIMSYFLLLFTTSATAGVRRGIVIAMSVYPSVHRPHFQLPLVARVSGVFILYCLVMVSGKTNLSFWVKILAILNSKWPRLKLTKNIFYQVFFKFLHYFYMNFIALI